ncbi:MAG: hypothetical protein WBO10_11070 [Pyrinomonadaceae bacterium]
MQETGEQKIPDAEFEDSDDLELSGDTHRIRRGQETSVTTHRPRAENHQHFVVYLLVPVIFLVVTLLGGLRLASADNAFIFLKPALICPVFGAVSMILFARAGLISVEGWFSENFSALKNIANTAVLLTLFAATVQIYNGLLPEQGLPFWLIGFCFFWTLWNNLFAEFDPKRLLRSLTALFGLAFATKYLLLANLSAAPSGNWLQRIIENPGKEAFTWLLDLPQYSSGTGYIQFFTLVLYLLGLFILPQRRDQ